MRPLIEEGLCFASGEENDLPERLVFGVGEAVDPKVGVVAGEVPSGDRQSALRNEEDQHPARAEGSGHAGQEGMLKPTLLVVIGIRRVQEQH